LSGGGGSAGEAQQNTRAKELLVAAASLLGILGTVGLAAGVSHAPILATYFIAIVCATVLFVLIVAERNPKSALVLAIALTIALGVVPGFLLAGADGRQPSSTQRRYSRQLGRVLGALQKTWIRVNHSLDIATRRDQERRLAVRLGSAFSLASKRLRHLRLPRPERNLNRHIADRMRVLYHAYQRVAMAAKSKNGSQWHLNGAVAFARGAARRLRRAELQLGGHGYGLDG